MNAEKLLIHIGTGEDKKTYLFDYGKILNTEAIEIEEKTGRAFMQVVLSLPALSLISITAVVWILRKRDEPWLAYEDVKFTIDELEVDEPEPEPAGPKDDSTPAEPS